MTDLEETQHIPIWRYMELAKYLSMLDVAVYSFQEPRC
jgi:hypothetical protein